MRGAIAAAGLILAGAAPPAFDYSPQPRWAEDPETEVVCAAIRAECPGILKNDQIDAEWRYAELYDADAAWLGSANSSQRAASRSTSICC